MTLQWTGQTARRTAATVVLVALLGWLLLRLGDASQVAAALEGLLKRPALLALFLGSYTAAFALRAVAWRLLLPGNTQTARTAQAAPAPWAAPATGVGVVRLFGILQVALLANHVFPTKAGEVARVGLLARAGVPLATATGSTLVARLLDLAALCLVALALGPVAGVPGGHFETLVAPLALAGLAFGAAIGGCLLLGSGRLAPLWRRLPGRLARAAGLAQGAVAGAAATPPLHLAGAATVTLLSWLLEAGALWCTARAAGVPLAPATAATATAVTIALQGMQFTPGGLGLYETSLTGSLAVLGVPPGVGLSLALATHALKFAYAYTVGPLCLAVLALIPVVGGRGAPITSSPMVHPVMTCGRRLLHDLRRPPAAAGTPPRLLGAAVLLGLVTIAFYLTGVPLRSTHGARVNGDEPFYLLTTVSLLEDGDLDLANDYALHRERAFFDYPGELWRQSVPTADGRLLSPHNAGTSLLILPGYALGGLDGAKGLLAVLGGATVVWTVLLAHRATGHSGAALVAGALFGASAPLFVYSTQVYPEGPAALLVAVCAWLALGHKGGWRTGLLLALGLNGLLWLGVKYAAVVAVLAGLGAIRLRPGARIGFLALLAAGATAFGWFHLATYGGLTPYAVNRLYAGSTTVQLLGAHLEVGERLYRLAGLWIDREFGLFRWAPALLLVLPALPLVARRPGPARWTVLLVVSTQLLVATFFSVTMRGWWFPGRMMIAVLPLLAVPVAELVRRLLEGPAGGARPWLLAAVAALGAYGLGLSLALRQAVAAEVVVLAAEPFALPWAPFQVPGALFPLFTSYEPATWGLTAAWLLAGGGAVLLGRQLAADPAPSPYPRAKSEVPSPKSQAPMLTSSVTEA